MAAKRLDEDGVAVRQNATERVMHASSVSMKYTVARLIMNTLEGSMIVNSE